MEPVFMVISRSAALAIDAAAILVATEV